LQAPILWRPYPDEHDHGLGRTAAMGARAGAASFKVAATGGEAMVREKKREKSRSASWYE
jgi:hypothetical protein